MSVSLIGTESGWRVTEPRYLLDSNICIYILDGRGEALRARLETEPPGALIASAISFAEVMRGIAPQDTAGEAGARRLFAAVPVLPFDAAAARAYRTLPFKRARFDRLIAAHALALDLTLVTNDTTDFVDIPGLKLENWT